MSDDLYLLDGYGLIYRAHFALIGRPLTDGDGRNVSAIHGFLRGLFALRRDYGAARIAVALDPAGPTFRHLRYPAYKANRDPAPEDLHAQVPVIEEILELLGVSIIRVDGFEADDIMGSGARYCGEQGIACRLVSADKDLMQLLSDSVVMLRPEKGGGYRRIGPPEVQEEKGIRPDQMIDYLALIGDTSDNIPGVPGIGPKTAAGLLGAWQNLDGIYANLERAAKGAQLTKLTAGRESAYLSRELVTIRTDLDLNDVLGKVGRLPADAAAASRVLRSRDLRSLAKDLEGPGSFTGGPGGSGPGGSGPGGSAPVAEGDGDAIRSAGGRYSAILTEDDLTLWREKIKKKGIVALDTETTDLDPMRASLVGLSVSVEVGEAAYLPLIRPDGETLAADRVAGWLNDVFSDGGVRIIGQNFKYDFKVLRRAGVSIGPAWFDTMIAAWVLDASSPVGMDALADRYLGLGTVKFRDVVPKGGTFADVPLERAVGYAAEDADITLRLYRCLEPLLDADKERRRIFDKFEMPLQPILAEMELTGIGLDVRELETYGRELGRAILDLAGEIHSLCGREFNIASPKQLQEILFELRGLKPRKKTKTGYSTDNSVLVDLAKEDPVPEKVLLYRSLTKLKSTYVDVLPVLAHPDDERVHTSYSQTGAATGRLSSNNPNLQNIPVRDENGRRIRKAFKSRSGCLFISADYSQIELVVLAHMSGDEALARAFRDGVDVHARTAALLFGVDSSDVDPGQRRMAKAVNFGVMYGMSAFRLSNDLSISRKEAKHFIDAYFATYRGIGAFVDGAVELAERDGGVRTMDGRFRPLPGIRSRNRVEKAAAERAAVNSRIQGTAADIMKAAMISVDGLLKDRYPSAAMLLQVHDELLIEAPEDGAEDVARDVKSAMENAASLSVPLRASVEIGASWGDVH